MSDDLPDPPGENPAIDPVIRILPSRRSPLIYALVGLLFFANTINIGADLGAMGDAGALLFGGPRLLYVVGFGAICILMQIFLKYTRYVSILKWLALALFAYVATLFVVQVSWTEALKELLLPNPSTQGNYWLTVVAIFGTTISPYLFFWQASQEVEDIREIPRREPLKRKPHQAEGALQRIRLDTAVGMAFSNLVAISIMITVAATLHVAGKTNIESSAQAAEALKPIAGDYAFWLFAAGIIGRPSFHSGAGGFGGLCRGRNLSLADGTCPRSERG